MTSENIIKEALEQLVQNSDITPEYNKEYNSVLFNIGENKYAFQIIKDRHITRETIKKINQNYIDNNFTVYYILPTEHFRTTLEDGKLDHGVKHYNQETRHKMIEVFQAEKTIINELEGNILYFNKKGELEKPEFEIAIHKYPKIEKKYHPPDGPAMDVKICIVNPYDNIKEKFDIYRKRIMDAPTIDVNSTIESKKYDPDDDKPRSYVKIDLTLPSLAPPKYIRVNDQMTEKELRDRGCNDEEIDMFLDEPYATLYIKEKKDN